MSETKISEEALRALLKETEAIQDAARRAEVASHREWCESQDSLRQIKSDLRQEEADRRADARTRVFIEAEIWGKVYAAVIAVDRTAPFAMDAAYVAVQDYRRWKREDDHGSE